jgi:hypothetical protein
LLEEYLEGLRRNSAHASARESMRWARSEQAVVVAHARASMKKGGKK